MSQAEAVVEVEAEPVVEAQAEEQEPVVDSVVGELAEVRVVEEEQEAD